MSSENGNTNFQRLLDEIPPNEDWAVNAVELILDTAEKDGCSDIHITHRAGEIWINGRLDGKIFNYARIPNELTNPLLTRLRVLGNMSTFKGNEPQDGRIAWRLKPSKELITLRIAAMPTIGGHTVSIRFPDKKVRDLNIYTLGMPDEMVERIDDVLAGREGGIFVTGPSNSGKTTTIYSLMNRLNEHADGRLHFMTIEDPVERELTFADQIQINEARDLSYDIALPSALRHDPDVLMIGEIRDKKSAAVAMQASMTGHLVFSTIHAGRAVGIFHRLLTLEVEPHIVASAVSGAIAQRLARLLCIECRYLDKKTGTYMSKGCRKCNGLGFMSRSAIYETIFVDDRIQDMIMSCQTPQVLLEELERIEIDRLSDQGTRLLKKGQISQRELEYLVGH